jgi:hypothetical protein
MSPADVDELPDEMWAAMVRFMQREAAAIEAEHARLKQR